MGVQEEFDQLYVFVEVVQERLELVQQDWRDVAPDDAVALAALEDESWDVYLAALDYSFADDRRPTGLSAPQTNAWNARCDAIQGSAVQNIRQRARAYQRLTGGKQLHATEAMVYLHHAQDAVATHDTWTADWVIELLLGVWHGIEAGGADVFDEGADRSLFTLAKNFLVRNASQVLVIVNATRPTWPSDAKGRSDMQAAYRRLVSFLDE